jgi:hypothetical protein
MQQQKGSQTHHDVSNSRKFSSKRATNNSRNAGNSRDSNNRSILETTMISARIDYSLYSVLGILFLTIFLPKKNIFLIS